MKTMQKKDLFGEVRKVEIISALVAGFVGIPGIHLLD
jgi:hypothetical protein